MIDQGWITIHRKIKDSAIYRDSQAVHLWIHLLLSANHKENKTLIGNKVVEIKRGQILTGRKSLSAATGINEHKIDRLLKLFETCEQIKQQTFSKYRIVSIVNYDSHQSSEQQVSSISAASEQQVSTNNNANNENKSQKIKRFDPPQQKEVEDYVIEKGYKIDAEYFINFYESKGWMVGKNKMKSWKAAIAGWHKRNEEKNNETGRQGQNTGFDQRSRAKKVSDKLREIGERDIEQNGFTDSLGNRVV
jgi:hypothetical protein